MNDKINKILESLRLAEQVYEQGSPMPKQVYMITGTKRDELIDLLIAELKKDSTAITMI